MSESLNQYVNRMKLKRPAVIEMRRTQLQGFVYFENSDTAVNMNNVSDIAFGYDRMLIWRIDHPSAVEIEGQDYDNFCFQFNIKKPSPTPETV